LVDLEFRNVGDFLVGRKTGVSGKKNLGRLETRNKNNKVNYIWHRAEIEFGSNW